VQLLKRTEVAAATEDLKSRTLAKLGYDFARLIYLSSLRDFTTGEYHHHGLAKSFSEVAANEALKSCHHELFCRLTLGPLESLVSQIDRFIRSSPKDFYETLATWETLETYHVIVPSVHDPIIAKLFRSNVKIALKLLKSHRPFPSAKLPPSSPHPSLGQ
jgi:hypothetical protein